jgi:hypothetical protein
VERAAGRQAARVRGLAGNGQQRRVGDIVDAWHRTQQCLGVRVTRRLQHLADATELDHPAAVHHGHAVGDASHDAEVVGDQHHRHVLVALQLGEQREDLRLDRHVERRGRLVGDQHHRVAGERHRDHHALAHAAGELVRILVEPPLGVGDVHAVQQRERPGARLGSRHLLVPDQRLGDLLADLHVRRQRGHRVLEDHREARPAHLVELGRRPAEQLASLEARGASDLGVRGQQPHHGEEALALARTRLAHDADALAGLHAQREVIDRRDVAVGRAEAHRQRIDLEHGTHRRGDPRWARRLSGHGDRGHRAARRRGN